MAIGRLPWNIYKPDILDVLWSTGWTADRQGGGFQGRPEVSHKGISTKEAGTETRGTGLIIINIDVSF